MKEKAPDIYQSQMVLIVNDMVLFLCEQVLAENDVLKSKMFGFSLDSGSDKLSGK